MLRKLTNLTAALTFALAIAACGGEEKAAGNAAGAASGATTQKSAAASTGAVRTNLGPAETTTEMMRAFKNNDLRGIMKIALPDADYKKMATEWETKRKEPMTDQQKKEFVDGLAKLTGPTAIDDIMREVEPKLAEMKAQMPMMIGAGVAMGQQSIQANEKFTPAQKEQATAVLNAMQGWAMKTDFSDPARLRKALTEFANAAKASKITALDQVAQLNFDQLLDKGSVMIGGFKGAMRAYDFNMDEMMNSYKAEQISMSGDTAKIKTTMTMFGQAITSESEMIKVDGRWFSKESIEALKQATESVTGSKLDQPAGG
jgi:uncharacterized protein (DUF1810 family)